MHTQETKNQFIELRANGLSFEAIAEQLNVGKSTLVRWSRDHDAEIRSLRAAELDALYDKMFLDREAEADCLANLQAKIERELARRDVLSLSTKELIRTASRIRHDIRLLRKETVQPVRNGPKPVITEPAIQPPALERPAPDFTAN